MKKQFKSWTLFFILGLITLIAGIVVSIMLMTGVSAPDALYGIYILLWMIPLVLAIIIDRIFVRRFGNKAVNKVQLAILASIAFLWMVRAVVNMVQG